MTAVEFAKSLNLKLVFTDWDMSKDMGKVNKPKKTYRSSRGGTGLWKWLFAGKVDFVIQFLAITNRAYQVDNYHLTKIISILEL